MRASRARSDLRFPNVLVGGDLRSTPVRRHRGNLAGTLIGKTKAERAQRGTFRVGTRPCISELPTQISLTRNLRRAGHLPCKLSTALLTVDLVVWRGFSPFSEWVHA